MIRHDEYIFFFSCYIPHIYQTKQIWNVVTEITKCDRDNTTASELLNKLDQPKLNFYLPLFRSQSPESK